MQTAAGLPQGFSVFGHIHFGPSTFRRPAAEEHPYSVLLPLPKTRQKAQYLFALKPQTFWRHSLKCVLFSTEALGVCVESPGPASLLQTDLQMFRVPPSYLKLTVSYFMLWERCETQFFCEYQWAGI